jgi:hypothetical protein
VSRITLQEAQAWAEGTKLTISALDTNLLDHLEEEVVVRLSSAFPDYTTWTNSTTTPKLVRTIISKLYIAWVYDRQYSEDIGEGSVYSERLRTNAETLIVGLLDGTIELPGEPDTSGSPLFYPTDASSAMTPTSDDPSLGPAAFSMGQVFF